MGGCERAAVHRVPHRGCSRARPSRTGSGGRNRPWSPHGSSRPSGNNVDRAPPPPRPAQHSRNAHWSPTRPHRAELPLGAGDGRDLLEWRRSSARCPRIDVIHAVWAADEEVGSSRARPAAAPRSLDPQQPAPHVDPRRAGVVADEEAVDRGKVAWPSIASRASPGGGRGAKSRRGGLDDALVATGSPRTRQAVPREAPPPPPPRPADRTAGHPVLPEPAAVLQRSRSDGRSRSNGICGGGTPGRHDSSVGGSRDSTRRPASQQVPGRSEVDDAGSRSTRPR